MDPDVRARELAAESEGPADWFERLYAEADAGTAAVPWDHATPHQLLVRWAEAGEVSGGGRRALVVGGGYGRDAEYLARRGFRTTAFDISPTAIKAAEARHSGSPVRYTVADLLAPPEEWRGGFDLVLESMTVQSMPRTVREAATGNVASLVAPGGELLVIAVSLGEADPDAGPPWPLTRAEVEGFAVAGLRAVHIEEIQDAEQPSIRRWLAEFHRLSAE